MKKLLLLLVALVFVLLTLFRLFINTSEVVDQSPVVRSATSIPITSTLLSSTNITSAGSSSSLGVSYYREALGYVSTTATTGTITITWQTSPDNSTWYNHTAMSPITTTTNNIQALSSFGNYLRISYTADTTTSITATVKVSLKD